MANTYVRYPATGGGGVSSLNSLTGALTLVGGSGITITPSGGDTLTIAASGGGGSPGGNDTTIQFNDSGAFGGNDFLRWDGSHVLLGTNAGGLAWFNIRSQDFDHMFVQQAGTLQGYLIGVDPAQSAFQITDYTNGRNVFVAEVGVATNSIYIHSSGTTNTMDINNHIDMLGHHIQNWSDLTAISSGSGTNTISTTGLDSGSAISNNLSILTGDITGAAVGDSGALLFKTGDSANDTENSVTGDLTLTTGNNSGVGINCGSGNIFLTTGYNSGVDSAFSGSVVISTGDSSFQSGDVRLVTGGGLELDASSGDVVMLTGSPDGDGDSGSIRFATAVPGGSGVQGYIQFEALLMKLPKQSANPAGGAEGDCYWNSTAHTLKIYNGTSWLTVTAI